MLWFDSSEVKLFVFGSRRRWEQGGLNTRDEWTHDALRPVDMDRSYRGEHSRNWQSSVQIVIKKSKTDMTASVQVQVVCVVYLLSVCRFVEGSITYAENSYICLVDNKKRFSPRFHIPFSET